MTAAEVQRLLYNECGLKGLSGVSNDVRELEASADPKAAFALDYFVYRVGLWTGTLAAALGGLDAFVFTAGIGENSPSMRARIAAKLGWLGCELDVGANKESASLISAPTFRLKTLWFAIMLMTIMLPFHVVVVPQYILFNQLGWVNTFVPLILPKFLAVDAFFVFLMVQFIRGIPKELDEAARIDGCGHWRIFSRVMLPLMGPALATCAIFTFIWTWSDFFTPLIYLTDPVAYTVPVALRSFLDATAGSNWGAMFAMSVVTLIPLFLVFLFGQRFLVKGIATTGGK